MVNYSKHFALFSILLLILVQLSIVESVPVIKSGYTKNHRLFRPRQGTSNSNETENGFWTNVYFVITASDSFFGG
ncbi:hypothetical protein B9Z55_020295 [Caenorhabditis nigoni]|uniref:Uncharacterized protein n=1 Tax=Caenorhabditis nigoni TaxID=1611254 RepID=A0A2G5TM43_9PELO|nr:hypothetical protein B9Z55_020295 [Caenorhabditis nigoni]